MQAFIFPARDQWQQITQRPAADSSAVFTKVKEIIEYVRRNGDAALISYTKQFNHCTLNDFLVSQDEINAAQSALPASLIAAIDQAATNIRRFHQAQAPASCCVETMPGIQCWQRVVPVEKVGLYIPGGTAPLFSSLLMLGIPAQLAGCREVMVCSPPDENGQLHPAILYTASLLNITRVYKLGGAQAIAAMAYGTETISRVDKIFGPGNQYVTAAKQLVQLDGVAIDMPAGPSEVCILADESAHPAFVAADMLAQAEHGPDSQVMLITTSQTLANAVHTAINRQLLSLPRRNIIAQSLHHSRLVVMNNIAEAMDLVNAYAPEHLIICCADDERLALEVINAGSVFLGNYSPESAGDYASGTNHTLPTNGAAKAWSGVGVDSFMKKISFQKLSPTGLQQLANTVITMAEAEGLQAHANAVKIRTDVSPR